MKSSEGIARKWTDGTRYSSRYVGRQAGNQVGGGGINSKKACYEWMDKENGFAVSEIRDNVSMRKTVERKRG